MFGRFAESAENENNRTIVEQLRTHQVELELQNEELRRVQADLEASHARLFDLYELAPVGYVTLDASGVIVQSNLRAASLLGRIKSKLDGRLLAEYAFGDDADLYFQAYQKLLKTAEPQVCELKLKRAGHAHFWARLEMSLSRSLDAQHEPVCLIVIIDISERKLAQEGFDAFMNHSPLATAILDEDGRYVDVNPAMMRHTERSKTGWVGRSISEVWPAEARERLKRQHALVLSTNRAVSGMEMLPLGNQSRMQEVIHFPFQGTSGKKLVGCITFDMTERLRLETALREASQLAKEKETAEENTRAKSRFLSAMSHEIRTPLNGVIGMAGLLMHTSLTSEQRDHLRVVVDSSELLLRLVNDILDLSKIEAGKLDLESASFNLEDLVEETLRLMSFAANEKSLELACRYPAEMPRCFTGDAGRIRQVLINLISNAVKFTNWGHVSVEVETGAVIEGKCVVGIAVRDTGIGVSKEKQSILFDSFQQADASIFNRYGGTGLGLAIVKQIVEAMGGTVSVSSVEGQGASFRCEIPLAVAPGAVMQPVPETDASVRAVAPVKNLRVLVTDDNVVNQKIAASLLARMGCQVDIADGGKAAVAKVTENEYDVVFMDCVMPEMDGFETTVAIRKLAGKVGRVPIVALTASATTKDREQCLAVGMDDFLTKPIRVDRLRECLAQWAGEKK